MPVAFAVFVASVQVAPVGLELRGVKQNFSVVGMYPPVAVAFKVTVVTPRALEDPRVTVGAVPGKI
jgi:hypothetical protein